MVWVYLMHHMAYAADARLKMQHLCRLAIMRSYVPALLLY